MKSTLASRLGDIPGVASVVIDLEGFGRGIDVRLEPGADETVVMERLRALLAAYGVRGDRAAAPGARSRRTGRSHDVDVAISPTETGARIEVATRVVKSFRIVAAEPLSIVQGLADAWCQVVGRIPIEIVRVEVDDDDVLTVVGFDGEHEMSGTSSVATGWVEALTAAVGDVLDDTGGAEIEQAAS
jgi:hypothetical protein